MYATPLTATRSITRGLCKNATSLCRHWSELAQLLKKQSEVLEARTSGGATDTEILEYEIRKEVIHQMCEQLARSATP
jgi:hypothetical protein